MDALTKEQMQELDRVMIEELGIDVAIMMENAALGIAKAAISFGLGKKVLVLAGHGNNGGDALASARHLANCGYDVAVTLASPRARYKDQPEKQLAILEKMGISIEKSPDMKSFDIILDGLLGYNAAGNPRGRFRTLIEQANQSGAVIIAIDLPSGMDATTGKVFSPCIKAHMTVALCAAKKGLLEPHEPVVGKIVVAYMSVPASVYERFGLRNPFRSPSQLIEENDV